MGLETPDNTDLLRVNIINKKIQDIDVIILCHSIQAFLYRKMSGKGKTRTTLHEVTSYVPAHDHLLIANSTLPYSYCLAQAYCTHQHCLRGPLLKPYER